MTARSQSDTGGHGENQTLDADSQRTEETPIASGVTQDGHEIKTNFKRAYTSTTCRLLATPAPRTIKARQAPNVHLIDTIRRRAQHTPHYQRGQTNG